MTAKEKEAYELTYLYSLDMNNARHCLDLLKKFPEERAVRQAILVVLVVTYARPFVGSQGRYYLGRGDTHRIDSKDVVPPEFEELHAELIRRRHEQFAHTDWKTYRPMIGNIGSKSEPAHIASFRNPDFPAIEGRLADIEKLVHIVEAELRQWLTANSAEYDAPLMWQKPAVPAPYAPPDPDPGVPPPSGPAQ